jgi:hypothetical protein
LCNLVYIEIEEVEGIFRNANQHPPEEGPDTCMSMSVRGSEISIFFAAVGRKKQRVKIED